MSARLNVVVGAVQTGEALQKKGKCDNVHVSVVLCSLLCVFLSMTNDLYL